MLRRLGLAAALTLSTLVGCSTGAVRGEFGRGWASQQAVEYVVSVRSLGPGTQGEHWGGRRAIYLDPRVGLEQTLARHVAAHELGHALMRGGGHTPAPSIMADRHGEGEALITTLTPQEVRAASGAVPTRVRADSSVPPVVYEALAWGCELWNRALGRQVLSLSR